MKMRMGMSGRAAQAFLTAKITPLLALFGVILGVFAVALTPREEEPQIDMTFANVFIPFPGTTASEVEQLVSTPAEQVLSGLDGLEHVYSASRPGMSVLTVQFAVGEDRTAAIVRLYNALYSNQDWLPPNLGVGNVIVDPMGIDDVPIITLTLWNEDGALREQDLRTVAHSIEVELKRVPGTRDVYTVGGPERVVKVTLDPQRLSSFGVALDDLRKALRAANTSMAAGSTVADNREIVVQAGAFLTSPEEVAHLVVGVFEGAPVYLYQVADVRLQVMATQDGFRPLAMYARRAAKPLVDHLSAESPSWDILGTNLSFKNEDGSWNSDVGRLLMMDRRDFNKLGIGIDDLIDGYIQTVLSAVAIDRMACQLISPKGTLRRRLFKSLNDDNALIDEIM